VREDEAHAELGRQAQHGDDRLEIVAVGAEAVQEDDGAARFGGGFDHDGGQQGCAHATRS
jgi:hypothetical protein